MCELRDRSVIGADVIVYDRYLFAVPVRGVIRSVAEKDGAYQVDFYQDNPGGLNVCKHSGGYFHHQQCEVLKSKAAKINDPVSDFKALSVSAEKNKALYNFDKPDPKVLEKFPTPKGKAGFEIRIKIPEFSSLCPITGQPDWAKIVIEYNPDKWCVESKSLKLYKEGFRNFGEFHEACCQRICTDLVYLLDPLYIQVKGIFVPRGGVVIHPIVEYSRSTS